VGAGLCQNTPGPLGKGSSLYGDRHACPYRELQLRRHPDRGERLAGQDWPVPLHHVPQGKRRAVHSQRHLACGRRRGPRRHGKLEGLDGRPPLLPVLRLASLRCPGWHRRDRDWAGGFRRRADRPGADLRAVGRSAREVGEGRGGRAVPREPDGGGLYQVSLIRTDGPNRASRWT
jgi:hypothetical protein